MHIQLHYMYIKYIIIFCFLFVFKTIFRLISYFLFFYKLHLNLCFLYIT